MPRIHTKKSDLDARLNHIRNLTGRDFFLQGAYGGWQLMENNGQGASAVTTGFVTKREMMDRINHIAIGMSIGARMCREEMQKPDSDSIVSRMLS
jgi:hypothetical protein